MVGRRGIPAPPVAYVAQDGVWPHGPWAPDAPRTALVVAALVQRVEQALWDCSVTHTEAATGIGVSRRTLQALLAGEVVPDMHTIVSAENWFGVRLWPTPEEVTPW